MFTVKIEASAESSKSGTVLASDIKTVVDENSIDVSLGKILYSVEEMGYPFVTDEVYQSAMKNLNIETIGAKYCTIYNDDIIKVSLRRTA